MRTRCIFIIVLMSVGGLLGCRDKPAQPGVVWFTVLDKAGSAALQFDQWVLILEGVPSKGVPVGSRGTINLPNPGGSGESATGFGALKIKQSWNGDANLIVVNGNRFTLNRAGKKLAFTDHTYRAGSRTKTIAIAKDGSTREVGDGTK